jgi:hypothetical protein
MSNKIEELNPEITQYKNAVSFKFENKRCMIAKSKENFWLRFRIMDSKKELMKHKTKKHRLGMTETNIVLSEEAIEAIVIGYMKLKNKTRIKLKDIK